MIAHLCTVEDVSAQWPLIPSTQAEYLIGIASRLVYAYTGREALYQTEGIVEKIDGTASCILQTREYPILNVTSIVDEDGLEVTDYTVLSNRGMLEREGGWYGGAEEFTVTYDAGLDPEDFPDIKYAALMTVRYLFNNGNGDLPANVKRRKLADSEIEYVMGDDLEVDLPFTVRMLLNPYRKVTI